MGREDAKREVIVVDEPESQPGLANMEAPPFKVLQVLSGNQKLNKILFDDFTSVFAL